MAFVLMFSAVYVFAVPAITQLAYDDGGSDFGANFDFREYKAVKFTLTDFGISGAAKIKSVDVFWYDCTTSSGHDLNKYRVNIYNKNGNQVSGWTDWIYLSPPCGWNTVDLSSYSLNMNNAFYVVVNAPFRDNHNNLYIGIDEDTSGESYYRDGSHFHSIIGANYMIRANVEGSNNPPTMTSILDNKDPVKSLVEMTITPSSPADVDNDQLQIVCGYSTLPTIISQVCSNYPQSSSNPYSTLNCAMLADNDNAEDTIYCRLYDGKDYSSQKTAQNTDDNKAPDTSIYVGDDAGTDTPYDDDLTVWATLVTGDKSGINSCEIDFGAGLGWEPVSTLTTSKSHLYATDGEYTLKYQCTDNVGWTSSVAQDTIKVDTTAPTEAVLTVADKPEDGDGEVILTWIAATDSNGITKYEVWRKDDQGHDWTLQKVLTSDILTDTESGLANGVTYTWKIRAYDPINHNSDSNEDSTYINTESPKTDIISPVDGVYFDVNSVEVKADYSDLEVVSCFINDNSGAEQPMITGGEESGTATYTFLSLTEGEHKFTVRCSDGIHDSKDAVTITVDTIKPIVSINLGKEQDTPSEYDNDGKVWAMLTNSDANPDYCEIDWGDGWATINIAEKYSSMSFGTDGSKTVSYKCTDKAKHEGILLSAVQTVEVASCPAPAPTGSSGGGGGGGSRKVTFTCNYDCGTWSDCANSKQTRTCTPNQYCEGDANKPETEKTCTVQTTSTQGSSTGTSQQQSGTEETGETTDEGSDNEGNTPTGFAVAPTNGGGIIIDWLRIIEEWLASIFAAIFG